MGVGEKGDSRVLPFYEALGVECGHLRPYDGTTLSCLSFWKPILQSTANQILHIPATVFFSPLNLRPWPCGQGGFLLSYPNFGNGRGERRAITTLPWRLISSKQNKTTTTIKTTLKKKKKINWREGLVPFNSTFIVPLLVLDFCAFFLSLFEAIKIFLDNYCFFLLLFLAT